MNINTLSVYGQHKNRAVVYSCCIFKILSHCVCNLYADEHICSLYLISKKLHVAFELLCGICRPISLQALSRKCPLIYQPFLGLQLLWQL